MSERDEKRPALRRVGYAPVADPPPYPPRDPDAGGDPATEDARLGAILRRHILTAERLSWATSGDPAAGARLDLYGSLHITGDELALVERVCDLRLTQ